MKIVNLTENSKIYTSNAYLVLGTWNTIEDTNTLIDAGSDRMVIQKLENMNTGLGKKKLDQVIITHSHSDHTAILTEIIKTFCPKVYAFNSHLKGVTNLLKDGDTIRIGEKYFEVFHITAHSYDSICLFCEADGILFSGDTTFPIEFENHMLRDENKEVLLRLQRKHINIIYAGHGPSRSYSEAKFHTTKELL